MLDSASERFCAAAWVPGGYAAVTLSTRLLLEEDGLGAWAEGPCAGAPASNGSQSQYSLLAVTVKWMFLVAAFLRVGAWILNGCTAIMLSTMLLLERDNS